MVNPPLDLVAYVTARCTHHCAFCTAGSQLLSASDMTAGVLDRCLAALPSVRAVCLAGLGEPLLADELPDLVDVAARVGRTASLITNGQRVAQRFDEVPWDRLSYVNVSVNEIEPRAYEAVTGGSALAVVEGAIDRLLEARVRVVVSFTVTRQSAVKMPLFVEWAAEHGVSAAAIVNRLPRLDGNGLVEDPEAFWGNVILEGDLATEHHARRARETAARFNLELQCLPVPISRELPVPSRCRSPHESIGIDGTGAVSLCRRLLAPAPEWGSVLESGMAVWTSKRAEELRRRHAEGDVPERCRACFGAWFC